MENGFNYFHGSENEQYLFLQMPWMLIKHDKFKGLSDSSKILYSLFLNRTALSAKNGWMDEHGRVYIIYTLEEITDDLNCWKEKALKSMKELKEIGLVKTIRRGLGKPNIIYVMNFATDLKYQTRKPEPEKEAEKEAESPIKPLKFDLQTSGKPIFEQPGERFSNHSNIYRSKIDPNVDTSIYPAQAEPEAAHQEPAEAEEIDLIDKQNTETKEIPETPEENSNQSPIPPVDTPFVDVDIDTQEPEIPEITKEEIAEKIGLADLISEQPDKEEKIYELYNLICEVLMTDDTGKIRVSKRQRPAITVKQEFSKLGKEHIIYVLDCLEKNVGNIKDNAKGYILTSLYNSPHSIEYYKPQSQSAFKDEDNSKPKMKSEYDVSNFFERQRRNPLKI